MINQQEHLVGYFEDDLLYVLLRFGEVFMFANVDKLVF
jgi:hypothetical protein